MGRKNVQTIKFKTARPKGVLRGGLGSTNRGRPLKPVEEHTGILPKERDFLLRIL